MVLLLRGSGRLQRWKVDFEKNVVVSNFEVRPNYRTRGITTPPVIWSKMVRIVTLHDVISAKISIR